MSTSAFPIHADDLELRLPRDEARADGHGQDEEYCELVLPEGTERIRFHDYERLYDIPGLYERIFYTELKCDSPRVMRGLLENAMDREGERPDDLVALDLGAGNGMVAEELRAGGADRVIGLDILEEAAMAARRDRPSVYDDYHVCDLTDPPAELVASLRDARANCLTTVAALGFGDIPPRAFATAFDVLEHDAWVAFNIKEDFVHDEDPSGFSLLIKRLVDEGALEVLVRENYRHRLAVSGEPLHYFGYIARKRGALDGQWVVDAETAA